MGENGAHAVKCGAHLKFPIPEPVSNKTLTWSNKTTKWSWIENCLMSETFTELSFERIFFFS